MTEQWLPLDSAPTSGILLLAVESRGGERRRFVAEASHGDRESYWMTTTGWHTWRRLHSGWTPIAWMPLPDPPGSEWTSVVGGSGEEATDRDPAPSAFPYPRFAPAARD